MKEYISIKDFALKVGVSPQALYQRLDKDLKPFLKVVESKKTLNIKALELFTLKEVEQVVDKAVDKDLLKTLQATLKVLEGQLEAKDKQIADLNDRLKEAQELNRNNQILLGSEQTRNNPSLLMGEDPKEGNEEKVITEKVGFFKKIFGNK